MDTNKMNVILYNKVDFLSSCVHVIRDGLGF